LSLISFGVYRIFDELRFVNMLDIVETATFRDARVVFSWLFSGADAVLDCAVIDCDFHDVYWRSRSVRCS
jgi:hypothetical protein